MCFFAEVPKCVTGGILRCHEQSVSLFVIIDKYDSYMFMVGIAVTSFYKDSYLAIDMWLIARAILSK